MENLYFFRFSKRSWVRLSIPTLLFDYLIMLIALRLIAYIAKRNARSMNDTFKLIFPISKNIQWGIYRRRYVGRWFHLNAYKSNNSNTAISMVFVRGNLFVFKSLRK